MAGDNLFTDLLIMTVLHIVKVLQRQYKIVLQGCVTPSLCWDLDLLHVNDIHVRMEETNKYSAACRSSTFNLKTKWSFQVNNRTFSRRDKVYF